MRPGDLPPPWRGDPYLLGEHAHAEVRAVRATAEALVAVLEGAGRGCGLYGLGDPAAVAPLVAEVTTSAPDVVARTRHASLERGSFEALDGRTLVALGLDGTGSSWDWMWTSGPLTADPGGAERLAVGPGTTAEVAELLSRAHPTASIAPDDERVVAWWGVRQGGRLVAVTGAIRYAPGLPPHLVSLGVDPATRGRGLAGVVLSAAVRDCLGPAPATGPRMVSLALYASNEVARRVYLRLGFRLGHRFATRRRPAEPQPARPRGTSADRQAGPGRGHAGPQGDDGAARRGA